MRRLWIALAGLVVVSSCDSGQSLARETASSPAPPDIRPVIYPCFDSPVREPAELMIACGDGKVWLIGLTWHDWGAPTANATGQLRRNNCEPSCVEGSDVQVPASVAVTGLVDGSYSAMRVVPQGAGETLSIVLDKTGPVIS